jgi:branched-subunit amino acid transport protein
MDIALLIFAMALVTFATRYGMIVILGRWSVPPIVRRALRYVPIAAFSAIVAPELLARSGELAIALDNPRLVAGIVTILVAAFTRQMLPTILVGMGALWFVQSLIAR